MKHKETDMAKKPNFLTVLVASVAMLAASVVVAKDILTDLIKIGGVAAVVDKFGPDINKALNKVQNFSPSQEMMTKVVPIISAGAGKYIGMAQVMGPSRLVDKVKFVAQVETKFFGSLRLKALVPVESKDIIKDMKRVVGVGVSGIVDLKI
jgi:hypothetical protein